MLLFRPTLLCREKEQKYIDKVSYTEGNEIRRRSSLHTSADLKAHFLHGM